MKETNYSTCRRPCQHSVGLPVMHFVLLTEALSSFQSFTKMFLLTAVYFVRTFQRKYKVIPMNAWPVAIVDVFGALSASIWSTSGFQHFVSLVHVGYSRIFIFFSDTLQIFEVVSHQSRLILKWSIYWKVLKCFSNKVYYRFGRIEQVSTMSYRLKRSVKCKLIFIFLIIIWWKNVHLLTHGMSARYLLRRYHISIT